MPLFLKPDINNSDNVRRTFEYNDFNPQKFDRVDKLMKYIPARFEEKFKDFRMAFRHFDKNFDGGLNFKEVMIGLEDLGVRMRLGDFKLLFDFIDYDRSGEIDFSKFILMDVKNKKKLLDLR